MKPFVLKHLAEFDVTSATLETMEDCGKVSTRDAYKLIHTACIHSSIETPHRISRRRPLLQFYNPSTRWDKAQGTRAQGERQGPGSASATPPQGGSDRIVKRARELTNAFLSAVEPREAAIGGKSGNDAMMGLCRMLFGTALAVFATVSSLISAHASSLNIETTPARVPAASPARGDFYVLGAATLDLQATSRFRDNVCSSQTPAALYGCGTGVDGADLSASGEFARTPGFEVGAGYAATKRVRVEATVQYRPPFSFNGHANFVQTSGRQDVSADISSVTALVSANVDLPGRGRFSPFLGCGGGLARNSNGETRMAFPRTTTIVPGASRTGFAFMLTAGVAARILERVAVDVGWRYLDAGVVETGRGRGRIVWRDGSREPLELDLAETRANLSSHGLRVSLRYAL